MITSPGFTPPCRPPVALDAGHERTGCPRHAIASATSRETSPINTPIRPRTTLPCVRSCSPIRIGLVDRDGERDSA